VGEKDEEEKLPEPLKVEEIKKYAGDYISEEGVKIKLSIKRAECTAIRTAIRTCW